MTSGAAGGSAGAGGFDFQARIAAGFMARILAEDAAVFGFGLPDNVRAVSVRCETEAPVDDVLVETSASGVLLLQAKRGLTASSNEDSEFASVLSQFARQWLASAAAGAVRRSWERPLNLARDRLVLAVDRGASRVIREELPSALARLPTYASVTEDFDAIVAKASVNQTQREVLGVAIKHLISGWNRFATRPLGSDTLVQILRLVQVQELSLDDGGEGERSIVELLKRSVVSDPTVAGAAWLALVEFGHILSSERRGADRRDLVRHLASRGIVVRAQPSFAEDIAALRKYTARQSLLLRDLTQISGQTISRACTTALRTAAEDGAVVVVGEPGAGKSGALVALVDQLQVGHDVLFIAVDHLYASTAKEFREALSLTHELVDVLQAWTGSGPAFLVIDAFDAARGEFSAKILLDLLALVMAEAPRWRAVVSVREYDLRKSQRLGALFRGAPPSPGHSMPACASIRHVAIPRLTEEELADFASRIPALGAVLERATSDLRQLLGNPFNLRIVADLIEHGTTIDAIAPMSAQIDLLDRYFALRLVDENYDGQGELREEVVRQLALKMVADRQLRTPRSSVADPTLRRLIPDVLSRGILREWSAEDSAPSDRQMLAFSHNVIFDFVVERLVLSHRVEDLIDAMERETDLTLAIRPSLGMRFERRWREDAKREVFYADVFAFTESGSLVEIAKLIGPDVAARKARLAADFAFLGSRCDAGSTAAVTIAQYIVGALLTADAPPPRTPWAAFAAQFAPVIPRSALLLLESLLGREGSDAEAATLLGRAARAVFDTARAEEPREPPLVGHAIGAVVRTFNTDQSASLMRLRQLIEPEALANYGHQELFWLADSLRHLVAVDADFVVDIYRAAFARPDPSQEKTDMSRSRILGMVSTRRQDYRLGLHQLAESFPQLLAASPNRGVRAMVAALDGYVPQHHHVDNGVAVEEEFEFRGKTARIRRDFSSIWDSSGTYDHEDAIHLLRAFENWLEGVEDQATLEGVLDELAAANSWACVWRSVLYVAAKSGPTTRRLVAPLLSRASLLTSIDTSHAAGEYLKSALGDLDRDSRIGIERAILGLATPEHVETRFRLIWCLDDALIESKGARELRDQLKAGEKIENTPPVRFSGAYSRSVSPEEILRLQGVAVDRPENVELIGATNDVVQLAERFRNSQMAQADAVVAADAIRSLTTAITVGEATKAQAIVIERAVAHRAELARLVVEKVEVSSVPGEFSLCRDILLGEADRRLEPLSAEEVAQFDRLPSWGRPSAPIDAAAGLVAIAARVAEPGRDVVPTLERLAASAWPSVRLQIISGIVDTYGRDPELVWRMLEDSARNESSQGVLQSTLSALSRLARVDASRVASAVVLILQRAREGEGGDRVRDLANGLLADIFVWRGERVAGSSIDSIVTHISREADSALSVVFHLRLPLVFVDTNEPSGARPIRERAAALLERIVEAAVKSLEQHLAAPDSGDIAQAHLKKLIELIDRVALHLSAIFESEPTLRTDEDPVPEAVRHELYHRLARVIDLLGRVPVPRTAHHIVEILGACVDFDPKGTFLRLHVLMISASRFGYDSEAMAVKEIVTIVELYLSEHRDLFVTERECRDALVSILDIFVKAGWPAARRLTYKLDDALR